MAKITDLETARRARGAPEGDTTEELTAQALELLRRAQEAHGTRAAKKRAQRALTAAAPAAGNYMRIWIDRSADIIADLEARAAEQQAAKGTPNIAVNTTLRVLMAAVAALPKDGQRMRKTQARIAHELSMRANLISLAFQELRAVGAVLNRQRKDKSITWEIDAEYASQLNDHERAKAIQQQQQQQLREAADARKQAALDKVGHRVLPWPDRPQHDDTIIYDERQPPLIEGA